MRTWISLVFALLMATAVNIADAQEPGFKVLAFYSTTVEKAHVQFSHDAIAFYTKLAADKNFAFETTTDWSKMNAETLANYQVVMWLNDVPHNAAERDAFKTYMEKGGGWMGCHFAGYNDHTTAWPWFVQFLGGAVFYTNNWPPLPAKLIVEDRTHPATKELPATYMAPANEFYQWVPSPRLNKDVHVLLSLDPANFPLGKKNLLTEGDIPVVWTNTRYRMIYINMGHGDKILTSDIQNKLFADALIWLGTTKSAGPATVPAAAARH